jgi:hypothetical protein
MTTLIVSALVFIVVFYVTIKRTARRVAKVIDYCTNVQRCKVKYTKGRGADLILPSGKVVGPFTNLGDLEKFAIEYLNYDPKK